MAVDPHKSSRLGFKRPESILLVIHTPDQQTLLLKRIRPPAHWQSVTGSIQWTDETPGEAAVRELQEETGLVTTLDELRDWHRRFKFVIPQSMRNRFAPDVHMNVEHMFSICLPQPVPLYYVRMSTVHTAGLILTGLTVYCGHGPIEKQCGWFLVPELSLAFALNESDKILEKKYAS